MRNYVKKKNTKILKISNFLAQTSKEQECAARQIKLSRSFLLYKMYQFSTFILFEYAYTNV